ncbi:WD repeat-containing protein 97 [Trichoplax sp. H2]|nr:WD repeat-containing protein 97 [Trichoplax sp. H2]|eukprot:RDD47065.1 WD repeat-containing protein 97 [Trichoplax sp. H2]
MEDKPDTSRSTSVLSLRSKESEIIKTPWYYWNVIRKAVLSKTKPKPSNITIVHGVQQVGNIYADDIVYRVIFNINIKSHIILDSTGFHLYRKTGLKEFYKLPTLITDFLYAPDVNQYVGWCHDRKLKVLNDNFEVISTAKSPDRIACAKYNETTNELLTGGVGNITIWTFRHSARHLVPSQVIQDQLNQKDTVELLAMEQTASRSQRCFGAVNNSVMIFYTRKNQHIGTLKDIHIKKITCMIFYDPLKNLVTAGKDGSVKVWDNNYNLRLVFVGHSDEVTCLSSYPFGPYIVSGSRDTTMRVWSLETFDEADKIVNDGPVEGLWSRGGFDYMLSFTSWGVHGWKSKHCHNVLAAIGSIVKNIKYFSHPKYPPRTFCIAADSAVRMIDTDEGDILSTLLMPMSVAILDIGYSHKTDLLFAATSDGKVVKCKPLTNPCQIIDSWQTSKGKDDIIIRLCAYDYSEDEKSKEGGWSYIATAIQAGTAGNETLPTISIVFGGRKNGLISMYDARDYGTPMYEIEGHGAEITGMEVNPLRDQIISSAKDNTVKVWRVHAFSEEKLVPIMLFYCGQLPHHLAVIDHRLMVAFHEPSKGDFSTVIYNVIHKNRNNHNAEDDHTEHITGLAACPKMKLFASSSMDGTVRIWDEYSQLQRVIKLNAKATGITFCSDRGDILVGIGSHVHKICHQDYLPDSYLRHMVVMQFPNVLKNCEVKQHYDYIETLPHMDKKRLQIAKPTAHVASEYVDVLDDEEALEQRMQRETKEKGYASIKAREEELDAITQGKLSVRPPKPKTKPNVNKVALKKYLDLFYNSIYYKKTKVTIESDDEDAYHSDSSSKDENSSFKIPQYPQTGFFRRPAKKQLIRYQLVDDAALAPDGYVPNSILARALFQDDDTDDENFWNDQNWELPQLTTEQLAFLDSRKTPVIAMIDKYNKSIMTKIPPDENESPDIPQSTSYYERLQKALRESNSPDVTDDSRNDTPISGDEDDPEIYPRTPVEKHLSRPLRDKLRKQYLKKKEETKKTPSPSPSPSPPPRIPSPEPPKRTLPNFIAQFQDDEWFQEAFPDIEDESFPKIESIEQFLDALMIKLKSPNNSTKVGILEAICTLLNQVDDPLEDKQFLIRALLAELRKDIVNTRDGKKIIIAALRALHKLGAESEKAYIAELLVQAASGDEEIRNIALTILYQLGLYDLHNMLIKEINSWDLKKKFLNNRDRKNQLNSFTESWLSTWIDKFSKHIEHYTITTSREAVKQSRKKRSNPNKIVKDISKVKFKDKAEEGNAQSFGFIVTDYLKKKAALLNFQPNNENVSDRPEISPDSTEIAAFITPLEAINYFCEFTREEELEKSRQESRRKSKEQETRKNAILALPKINVKPCLARIGETHVSACHPHREAMHTKVLPSTRESRHSGFTNALALRMNVMTLAPFANEDPQYYGYYKDNTLLILQSSQKYFVPSRSYTAAV